MSLTGKTAKPKAAEFMQKGETPRGRNTMQFDILCSVFVDERLSVRLRTGLSKFQYRTIFGKRTEQSGTGLALVLGQNGSGVLRAPASVQTNITMFSFVLIFDPFL